MCVLLPLVFTSGLTVFQIPTGLIALKIWKIQRVVAPFAKGSQDEMSRLVAIIVESGESGCVIIICDYNDEATKQVLLTRRFSWQ